MEKPNDYKDQERKIEDNNDENQEEVLSWEDIVNMNDSLEREAEALLGGQNENVCTYPEGYKFRQPLYSCKTCAAETGQHAGVCYACSFNCHEGHDLVELYTKRKFCCDCGNSKFKSKCKLFEEKCEINRMNSYNHNFDQIYCVCKQVYPPVDDKELEEMHQCCVCEDWFHLSHIYAENPEMLEKLQSDIEENWEMVCKDCVTKLPFLVFYETKFSKNISEKAPQSIKKTNSSKDDVLLNSDVPQTSNLTNLKFTECVLKNFDFKSVKPHSIYFVEGTWRESLCKCLKCLDMYDDSECIFLTDPEDTMLYYDAERRRNMEIQGDVPKETLKNENASVKNSTNNMANSVYNIVVKKTNNRDAALNAYLGVQEMYKHMGEYFTKLGSGKVITRKDVENCFEELQVKRSRFALPSADDSSGWTQ